MTFGKNIHSTPLVIFLHILIRCQSTNECGLREGERQYLFVITLFEVDFNPADRNTKEILTHWRLDLDKKELILVIDYYQHTVQVLHMIFELRYTLIDPQRGNSAFKRSEYKGNTNHQVTVTELQCFGIFSTAYSQWADGVSSLNLKILHSPQHILQTSLKSV